MELLLGNPEQLQALRDDPGLIAGAVEEAVRMVSPVHAMFRTALEDVELGGVKIPKGGHIRIVYASANRDEARFHEPERFDIRRPDVKKHLAFGHGLHFCIGAPLARLEARIALEGPAPASPGPAARSGAEAGLPEERHRPETREPRGGVGRRGAGGRPMILFHRDTPDRLLVRIAAAAMMVIHGIARSYHGTVDDFGGFLGSRGLPAGEVIAWTLTLVEIAGGLALAAGHFRRPLALWFAVELAVGIALVHRHSGWFVVGAGTGGMEFSVLLIAIFLAVAWRGGSGR